jgi:hypothetical protein
MPQRTAQILWALLGAVAVLLILVCGVNVYRWARTGPRWRRRLVTAGLFLLAAFGLGDFVIRDSVAEAQPVVTKPAATPLVETAQWKKITHAWQLTAPFAATGKSTVAERKQVDEALKDARTAIGDLLKQGRIIQAEADLLNKDADRVRGEVYRNPPTDRRITCYKRMYITPAGVSLRRINQRLPMLKALTESGRITPEVTARVLPSIESDLAVLANSDEVKKLRPAEQPKAAAAHKVAAELVAKLKPQAASPLAETAEWKKVVALWQTAAPIATSGKSTTAQRKEFNVVKKEALAALAVLAKNGSLTESEANLLKLNAANLHNQVYRNPPTDSRAMCYDMMVLPPVHQSYMRVSKRLPLLKKALQENRLAPEVVARILPTLEADLSVLASEDQLKQIQGEQRDKARAAGAEAGALLERLQARMKK